MHPFMAGIAAYIPASTLASGASAAVSVMVLAVTGSNAAAAVTGFVTLGLVAWPAFRLGRYIYRGLRRRN